MPSLLRPDLYYKQVLIRLYLVKMTVILGRRGLYNCSKFSENMIKTEVWG